MACFEPACPNPKSSRIVIGYNHEPQTSNLKIKVGHYPFKLPHQAPEQAWLLKELSGVGQAHLCSLKCCLVFFPFHNSEFLKKAIDACILESKLSISASEVLLVRYCVKFVMEQQRCIHWNMNGFVYKLGHRVTLFQ